MHFDLTGIERNIEHIINKKEKNTAFRIWAQQSGRSLLVSGKRDVSYKYF